MTQFEVYIVLALATIFVVDLVGVILLARFDIKYAFPAGSVLTAVCFLLMWNIYGMAMQMYECGDTHGQIETMKPEDSEVDTQPMPGLREWRPVSAEVDAKIQMELEMMPLRKTGV